MNNGAIKYKRTQFPLVTAYAVTAHKSQGDTLDSVSVDFTSRDDSKPFIISGSFHVGMTSVKNSEYVYLKSFDGSFIKTDAEVAENCT